jgi:hypothetical protein
MGPQGNESQGLCKKKSSGSDRFVCLEPGLELVMDELVELRHGAMGVRGMEK